MESSQVDNDAIAEFQKRRRLFHPLWVRTVGFVFLPGFVLFVIGAQTDRLWLVIPGMGLCLAGAARGAYLVFRYRRCPICGTVQTPGWFSPYRTCRGCGTRHSVGTKDST